MTPDSDQGTRLREQLRILREGKWLIVLCVVLTTGAALAYSLVQQKEYLSKTGVLVRPDDLGGSLIGLSQNGAVDPLRQSATDLELVEQPTLAARVVRRLGLDESPDALLDRVQGSQQGNSSLIAIEVTDTDPAEAKRIADVYAAEYVTFRAATDRARVRRALREVRSQLDTARAGGASTREIRRLRGEVEDLSLLASLQSGNAEVIQQATTPTDPVRPRPVRNAMMGFIVGLILGIALAFLRDRLDPRIKDEEEVARMLPGVPPVASIPRRQPGVFGNAAEAEGFRSLQTTLTYLQEQGNLRSILVTSATIGEGKSTTSLNLALAIAERQESVILLEGDLRRRGLSERLGLDSAPGVSNLLSGRGDIDDVLVQISLDGTLTMNGHRGRNGDGNASTALSGIVSVIPAGPVPRNPHALLSNRAVETLLHDASAMADKVIVDGTPVGLVNDMLPVAGKVDAVIVIVQLYHTRRNELRKLVQVLQQAAILPFGVVLVGTSPNRSYQSYLRA